MEERRRSTRVALDGKLATLPSAINVQVLDISVAGVLLRATEPVALGTRGCLRLNMWGSAFAADVQVCRVSPMANGTAEGGFGIGAEFVDITAEHRQLIERFASQ
jgi:hypothetical protein